jgi:hypothetical protein
MKCDWTAPHASGRSFVESISPCGLGQDGIPQLLVKAQHEWTRTGTSDVVAVKFEFKVSYNDNATLADTERSIYKRLLQILGEGAELSSKLKYTASFLN